MNLNRLSERDRLERLGLHRHDAVRDVRRRWRLRRGRRRELDNVVERAAGPDEIVGAN
jgi:hypothetical protein